MGYYAAKYRGRITDSIINIIAVLVSSIPVFVLGILLFKFAGVIHLPAQYVPFAPSNSALKSYESLILPTVVVTLMGLPSVVFMSRNEFIEIFKSEYIKTAKGKGLSSIQIFRKHILRNGFMPILYATSGNLLLIFGGSIVIQIIFNISGNATGQGLGQMLADGVTSHQYYFECFSILFFSGVYFLYAILLDLAYVIVDPRVVFRNNSELLGLKVLVAKSKYQNKENILKRLTLNEQKDTQTKLTRQDKKFAPIINDNSIK
ncbi:ABC transporter permease [bacterium]|nr:ABC transporter permease [bacterium]MBO6072547.1 ABC transporter permease [bacterium]MBO6095443.1 ABC transporter permease [bacterium]MBO7043241.1 ABC transporter permease [bacterium]